MRIEPLSVDNLREGVFCAHGDSHGEEMYEQLGAWLDGNLLRGQIAREEDGEVAGFILYYAMENAPLDVTGDGLYMVQCLFVKPGHQSNGVGRALIESAAADALASGAAGIAVEGFNGDTSRGFEYMPGSFFERVGLTPGETRGTGTLYFHGFDEEAQPPQYLDPRFQPAPKPGKIRVDILDCRRCYVRVRNRDLVKTVLESAGKGKFDIVTHDQNNRKAILDKGMSSGVFIDGKLTFFRGPISEADVWQAIDVAIAAKDHNTDR